MRYAVLIVIASLLTSCAVTQEDRWLSAEEDAEMRAKCEPVGGCALVPMPLWDQIKEFIIRFSGTEI